MNARITKIKRDDTITALHEFDGNQTNALGTIERDLNTMETWLSDIEGLFKSGLTDVNFPVETWALISSQNNLWTDLAYRTMPLGMRNTPGSIESTTPFSYTLPFDDGNLMTVEPAINACAVPTPAPENTGAEIAKGVGTGLYDAGKDFVTGIWDFITNPVESVKGVFYAVTHPVETYTFLKTAISDSYERDVINGDAYSRSRWFSYAAGTVATSVVGTKGAGALTKTSMATTTSVVQNTTLQSQRLMNMYPYGPQSKLSRLGDVPYNVLNGPVIRNQVLSTVKAASKNASILKSPSAVIKEKITAVQTQLAKGAIEVGKVVDQTITNTKNVMSNATKGPQFSFASGVVKSTTTNTHVARNPGKDMVSKVESVNIGGKDVVKGTDNASRIIPGKSGAVTGGNSTKLGKNMIEQMGLKRSTKWSGYQAQHIIPSEMTKNPVIEKIGMNFDDASNGIFLRTPENDISTMSRHRGYHSVYNEVVQRALNRMDINQSVDSLQMQVYDLQQSLKKLQEKGLPLYPSQGATVELWERKLKQVKN